MTLEHVLHHNVSTAEEIVVHARDDSGIFQRARSTPNCLLPETWHGTPTTACPQKPNVQLDGH
eukprot:27662-Eustigmatos_ZCMA.PRE.1